jgi:hypothetical protein
VLHAAPWPQSRAVERTLSFRLDSRGSWIRLETLLDRWAGVAAREHDLQSDTLTREFLRRFMNTFLPVNFFLSNTFLPVINHQPLASLGTQS